MRPTTLVYSSHDRSRYIHHDWIAQRALDGDGRLLFLPMSAARQDYSWGRFEEFFSSYAPHGLKAMPFFWSSELRLADIRLLEAWTREAEVVLLGGGDPRRGLVRYRKLGSGFFGEPNWFENLLHERQQRGLLTVGFSAGVDQLCAYLTGTSFHRRPEPAFGLCREILALCHYEPGEHDGLLYEGAIHYPSCLIFALPNDSGIASFQGLTPTGRFYQVLHFITDCSWDREEDRFHIKTRQGINIQHCYNDGRHWVFNGGDSLVRLFSEGNWEREVFILPASGGVIEYWSQSWAPESSLEEVIARR